MDRQVPGSGQSESAYQPASSPADAMERQQAPSSVPSSAGEPQQQEPQAPAVDYQAMLRQEQQARQAAESERQRLQQTLGEVERGFQQIQQQNQQQAETQAFQQRKAQILQAAGSMRQDEADRYISSQMDSLYNEFQSRTQNLQQTLEQRQMQVLRQVATPLYIDELVRKNNLPAEAREQLMQFGDPDIAQRQVPFIKQQYEERKKLEERLEQLARTQQANDQVQQGVNRLGGYNAASGSGMDIPEGLTGDERALYIYKQLRS
jgi:hypothetical protein